MGMRVLTCHDNNISELREQYADGLHFVVGDIHGEWKTLEALMDKICFDPAKDHVYFVGDYNMGGDVQKLLTYISGYYQEDHDLPGFHLIRGNHERELGPYYPLENMPDIIVVRREQMNYYIAHAGMLAIVYDLINSDLREHPDQMTFAYRLADNTVCFDAPFRQIIWSRRGLYSQRSRWHNWPAEPVLKRDHSCIIHGHTPYCFFMGKDYFSYGEQCLFWSDQHIFFSEDLQSFDIDSNIKGLFKNGENYRGIACLCLEVLEEVAAANGRSLTVDGMADSQNGVFSAGYIPGWSFTVDGDIQRVLSAAPKMKTITMDEKRMPVFETR